MDKPKDWYKSMFKAMHKAGRSGYVGESDIETDMEGGKKNDQISCFVGAQ